MNTGMMNSSAIATPHSHQSFNSAAGWNFEPLAYADFWSPSGFIRNLFYNGFHPVIPWAAFMLFGLWYGRQNLYDIKFVERSFWNSWGVFILIQILSSASLGFIGGSIMGAYMVLTPVMADNPSESGNLLARKLEPRTLYVRPHIAKNGKGVTAIEGAVSLLTF